MLQREYRCQTGRDGSQFTFCLETGLTSGTFPLRMFMVTLVTKGDTESPQFTSWDGRSYNHKFPLTQILLGSPQEDESMLIGRLVI